MHEPLIYLSRIQYPIIMQKYTLKSTFSKKYSQQTFYFSKKFASAHDCFKIKIKISDFLKTVIEPPADIFCLFQSLKPVLLSNYKHFRKIWQNETGFLPLHQLLKATIYKNETMNLFQSRTYSMAELVRSRRYNYRGVYVHWFTGFQ